MKLDDLWYKYCGKRKVAHGRWEIIFIYKGKYIKSSTTNSEAIDRINNITEFKPYQEKYGYTEKQALQSLYNECKRKNNLK